MSLSDRIIKSIGRYIFPKTMNVMPKHYPAFISDYYTLFGDYWIRDTDGWHHISP